MKDNLFLIFSIFTLLIISCEDETEPFVYSVTVSPDNTILEVGGSQQFTAILTDENGEEVSVNTVGEIVAKGERIMSGYWNNDEATMDAIKNGWLHTGDLGYRDEDGYIFLAGRAKDFIKRGGEMISPEEIEQILYRHPDVEEVAVIGLPDIQWGEIVTAVIKCKRDKYLRDDEILAFCNDKLASFKRPEKIIFISELPRNSMGKILKKDLRDEFSV